MAHLALGAPGLVSPAACNVGVRCFVQYAEQDPSARLLPLQSILSSSHWLPFLKLTLDTLVFLWQIPTGLRDYCRAPALSAILLCSERQRWEDAKGRVLRCRKPLQPEEVGCARSRALTHAEPLHD